MLETTETLVRAFCQNFKLEQKDFKQNLKVK